jgi:hypothetical protein
MARDWNALLSSWIPSVRSVLFFFSLLGCFISLMFGAGYASVGIFAPVTKIPVGDSAAAGQALGLNDKGPDLQFLTLAALSMAMTFLGSPRRQMGLALPKSPVLGMVAAFCITLAGDMAVVYLQLLVPASAAAEPGGAVSAAWRSQSGVDLFARSLTAGVTEEYLMLATPVGVAVLACAGISLLRTARAAEPLGYLRVFGYALAAGLLFIVPRSEIHAYQGRTSVLSAAVWTAVHLAVFLYYKSVWPLIIAHTSYDFFIAGGLLGAGALDTRYITLEVVLLALAVLAGLLANRGRRKLLVVDAGGPDARWWAGPWAVTGQMPHT